MANKEIGSLLVKLQGNSSTLVKSIDNTIDSLARLSMGLEQIKNVSLKGLTSKFTTMANAMNKFANSFNEGTLKRISSVSTYLSKMGNSLKAFTNMNVELIGMNFWRLSTEIDPFLNKLKDSENLLNKFSYALDVGKLLAELQLSTAQVSLLNEKLKTQEGRTQKVVNQANLLNEKLKTEQTRREKTNKQIDLLNEKLALANHRQESLNAKSTFWNNLWKIGKLDYFIRTLTRIGRKFGQVLTMGAEFNETLNKFQSATRENYQNAITFARQMAREFGLAEKTVMNYQSTFVNMLNSLDGLSSDIANKLGQSLTIMATDYASLFNTTIESAMNAFQSVLSGRTTAIRSASGIDVTQNTIYEYYKDLGGTKTLNALSQLEKRLLRILAVYKQMNEAMAVGDLADTLNSFSNQARILSEQFKEIGVWISNITIGFVEDWLPTINAIAITFKELLKTFAYLTGYEQQTSKPGILETWQENGQDLSLELEGVNDQIKEMIGLLSFDKFNILNGSTTSGATNDINLILEELLSQTSTLEEAMESAELKANELSDNWLTWLGYVKEVHQVYEDVLDAEGNIMTDAEGNPLKRLVDERVIWNLKEAYTNIESIGNIISSVLIVALAPKIIALTSSIIGFNGALSMSANLVGMLNKVASVGLVYTLLTLITQWDELSTKSKVLYFSLLTVFTALTLLTNLEKVKVALKNIGLAMDVLRNSVDLTKIAMVGILSIGIVLIANMDKFSSRARAWIGVLGTLTGALLGVATAIVAIKSGLTSLTATMALGAITSFAVGAVAINKNLQNSTKIGAYANGGFPTTGEMFIAREQGPEFVGSMGGKTTVANNYQIEQGIEEASYRGFTRAMQENSNGANRLVIDGKNVDDSAFVRAIMPALRMENTRIGGR